MPEGDTVHKVAVVLREGLVGRELTEVQLRGVFQPQQFAEAPVESVEAIGKHLLVTAGPLTARVHLGMHGSWSSRRGETRGQLRRGADVVLATADQLFACHKAKDVELFRTKDRHRHPALSALGPDLLGPEPDYQHILARVPRGKPLGELLLDQRVAAGLGNVYKSELAFLGPEVTGQPFYKPGQACNPWLPPRPEDIIGLYRRGREALLANLGGWHRTTTVDRRQRTQPRGLPTVWVYGREGKPCLRCRTLILRRAQGDEARSTYWCPRCQGLG